MTDVTHIGSEPWTRQQMKDSLEEFASLYQKKPLSNNEGGMKSPHMFLAWFVLKTLKPKAIVESGVWHGQGTWLFEKACPNAELHCIDLNLKRIKYRSDRAKYYAQDFSTIDWGRLPKKETVLFFDDHQNAYERLKTAKWFGFLHLLFEDNYPLVQGDCCSLKKIFMCSGLPSAKRQSRMSKIHKTTESLLGIEIRKKNINACLSGVEAGYVRDNLDVYCELPPVFKIDRTRWGDLWDEQKYPTPPPLLDSVEKEYQKIFHTEAAYYTWMCYVKLK